MSNKEQELMSYFEGELQRKEMEKQALVNQNSAMAMGNQQQMMTQENPGIIKEQLDLGPELKRIDYLLRSWTTIIDENGISKWGPPKDENGQIIEDMIILSDYGVKTIRDKIAWYINKNTLLSNYDEETILDKMKDFATDLNDTIFLEYEKIFHYPSLKRCKQELLARLDKQAEIKEFARKIVGIEADKGEIRTELLAEMENRVEIELDKIKEKLVGEKLKKFSSILREVQDAVHSTYLRAYEGQERRSIRQHMQVTETRGGVQMPESTAKKGGMFPWSKK